MASSLNVINYEVDIVLWPTEFANYF